MNSHTKYKGLGLEISPKETGFSSPGTKTSPDSTTGSSKTTSSLSWIGSCISSGSGSLLTSFHHSFTLKHGHCLCQFFASAPHISLCPRISASGQRECKSFSIVARAIFWASVRLSTALPCLSTPPMQQTLIEVLLYPATPFEGLSSGCNGTIFPSGYIIQ